MINVNAQRVAVRSTDWLGLVGKNTLLIPKRKAKNRRIADLDPPIVHEGCRIQKRFILLRASLRKIGANTEIEHKHTTGRRMDGCHAVLRMIDRSHAVVPGIHVPAVESGEAKRPRENCVK